MPPSDSERDSGPKSGNSPDSSAPSGSGSQTPSDPSTSPKPANTESPLPFRHRSNAPNSSYPPIDPAEHPYRPHSSSSSSRQSNPSSSSSSANPAPPRSAPTLHLPSIVTLVGRPSHYTRPENRNDERCITYCTQTAARRSLGQQPVCTTLCWRRLTPQDYWDYPARQASGKPYEGQGEVIQTSVAGAPAQSSGASASGSTSASGASGASGASEHAPKNSSASADTSKTYEGVRLRDGRIAIKRENHTVQPAIFGFDGRFVYYGKSRFRAVDRMTSMSSAGLAKDWTVDEIIRENDPRREDEQYMEWLRKYHQSTQIEVGPLPSQLLDSISESITAILKPSSKYIDSFAPGGAQERFALKVWEKAKTGEGLTMLATGWSKRWEEAKKKAGEAQKEREKGNKPGNGKDSKPPTSSSSPPTS